MSPCSPCEISHILAVQLREVKARLKAVFNHPGRPECCWLDGLLLSEILGEGIVLSSHSMGAHRLGAHSLELDNGL
jgi:hypothetical protein